MKLLVAGVLILAAQTFGQEPKHITLGCKTCGSSVSLTAMSMQRDISTQRNASVLQLRGNVEIKTLNMILHAEAAEYHEDTGAIEARGHVRVTPNPEARHLASARK